MNAFDKNMKTMHIGDTSLPVRVYQSIPITTVNRPIVTSFPILNCSKQLKLSKNVRIRTLYSRPNRTIVCKSSSESPSQSNKGTVSNEEDFVTRVLKENPSQVEPKFQIGDKVYTLKERQNLMNRSFDFGAFEILKRLKFKGNWRGKEKSNEGFEDNGRLKLERNVHVKDILREYRGKLYVPKQVFGVNLSEEEEFERDFEALPKMSYEDFGKFMKSDKIKLLITNEGATRVLSGDGFRDFIVELKETPGAKGLRQTKWAMTLDADQAEVLLDEYKGSIYEIETQRRSWIGKLPEDPIPVASSISSRIMIELGIIAALMTIAALFVGGFLASTVLAATTFVFAAASFVFGAAIYVVWLAVWPAVWPGIWPAVWPVVRAFLKISVGTISAILDIVRDNIADIFSYGGIFSDFYKFCSFSAAYARLDLLGRIASIFLLMVLVARLTLSGRPKNFRKWDIWQGIEFSQSKPQARVDGSTGVTFADVAGIEEAVEELQELVKYLKNPELFDKMGIKPPHGVLLEGPPGCGKTLVAKAIAGEAGVPFYQMAGPEFVEVLVGVGSARIRDLFKRAKVNKPSVIFVDEIDALATRRQGIFSESTDHLYNAATQERETTLNQLLIELDGFDTGKGVIFLGATNRMDLLDPALLRPGRFDRKIRIRPPNAKGRLDILKVHARKLNLSPSVDLSTYANNLPGWTGARLAQLLQEAALMAARKGHESIIHSDIDEAVDRLTVGPKRVGIDLGHQGQCRRATAELGTAITSHLLRQFENAKVECCDRVSINPRGQTLSQVVFHRLDDESCIFERLPQLLHRLQVLLGGRAAEEVIYGHDTSKASVSYLADASWLAWKIVTIWNMENPMVIHGEPPPWKKKVKFVGPRLDFEGSLYDDYELSEPPVNFNLDDQVAERTEQLLRDMYEKTVALLRKHHAALLKAVKVLLNQKELRGAEIDYILDKYPPQTPVSLLLEEEDPGSLPFFQEEQSRELEYALTNASTGQVW